VPAVEVSVTVMVQAEELGKDTGLVQATVVLVVLPLTTIVKTELELPLCVESALYVAEMLEEYALVGV